jgi:hypothetical protein
MYRERLRVERDEAAVFAADHAQADEGAAERITLP